ncbi:putative leucine-rich repeat domain superfamily [Helianthus annuus]|nr:putative leucine-rich repeat domain superfamily [Helianthus annuus]
MWGWKMWSTNDAVFPCLRELHINNCPELIDVSAEALPSLRVLEIAECGDGVLRSLVRAASSITKLKMSSISGLTYEVWRGVMERIGTVEEVLVNIKKLEVSGCSNLVSLGEKEEEDNFGSNLLSSLRILEVENCRKMERCCCPNNIESLYINYCRSLTHVSFPTAATGGGGQKLKSLDIQGCEKLIEKISSASMPMLESIDIRDWTNLKSMMQLGNFIYLTDLRLFNCPSLESFPDIQLPVLTRLAIVECNSMESLSALQMKNLSSLKHLRIRYCPSIDASCHGGVWPPNLCSLEIAGLKKPMSEWGPQKFPSSLVYLRFDKLESLSMGLQHLTSLQHLYISNCPKLKHLPKQLLPSLLSLHIVGCPDLRKGVKEENPTTIPSSLISPKSTFNQIELKEASRNRKC